MNTPENLIDRYDDLRIACLSEGFPGVCASGVMTRSPMQGTFYKAELAYIPMTRPEEYASIKMFEKPCEAPVLISPSQRYLILTNLVQELRQHVATISLIGVRLYGPDWNVQLPADLLAIDVLLTPAPLDLVDGLRQAGRKDIVIIQHELRADGVEQGDNKLAVWLLAPSAEGLNGFLRFSQSNACLRSLSDFTIERVHTWPARSNNNDIARKFGNAA